MSNLILPQKWTSQPQTPVGIDWSNPLVQALGLVDVWIPSTGILTPTLIRKFTPVVSVGNFSQGVNTSGRSLKYSAATANNGLILANDADELFPVANTASIFVIRQSLDTTARTSTLFGYHVGATGPDRTLAHAPFSDGNIYWDLGDATTAHRISVASGGKTTNKEAYAFIGGPTKGREIWRNGIKLAGDATKTGARAATTGSFRIGSASNTTAEASDLEGVNLFIIGSKEWPDWAIKALSDNPWQIFNPTQRRIWVASASSGSTGTVAVTNENDTSSASGTTTVTGSVAKSNANDTSAASGTTTITGSLARTNVNDTSAASGTPTVIGTLATTNANDTVGASGSVGNSITGTVAYTNANDTLSASGTTTIVGTVSRTNANDTIAANGTTTVIGTVSYTNVNDTIAASGIVGTISGTVAYTNSNDISTASGTAGSQASGSAPDYSVGKKKKFVVKVGDRLVVFSNQVDAINALPSEVKEPVKVKQYPAKKKSASANPSMANLQKPDSVPVAQPDETVPLQTVSEMAQAYNAQAQYDQLMRKMQYEALYSLYQDLLEEDDSEALLMVA